ncbi:phosphotransferase [Demequina sp. NBRC 110053]|uniref:phosphotransferase n=1 Tax=Demequina sp. NBRC 110053 TaxID=1570342 RepID=UPI000A03B7A7|nr:phosphotransferase [Demequina sp. NBRC 110053]
MTTTRTPEAEVHLDADLVRALLTEQHPDLAEQTVGERMDGWDNATFRLGATHAVRLPRREMGAQISAVELDWLPQMRRDWTFPAPVPVRIGQPGCGYPWRWSVVPWLQGVRAFDEPLSDAGARDLGAALAQVHRRPPANAPLNPFRSGTLADVAEVFDARVTGLGDEGAIEARDADALRALFEAGAATEDTDPTWTHLDLHGGNVLTMHGRLAGILDWGDSAAGDPATDLGQAWTLVGADHAAALLEAYGTAEGTLRVGAGSAGRTRVLARAAAYAVTLACIADEPYRSAGLRATGELIAIERA